MSDSNFAQFLLPSEVYVKITKGGIYMFKIKRLMRT